MSTTMLIALVIIFAVVLTLLASRRGPHVTDITRTVTRERKDGDDA